MSNEAKPLGLLPAQLEVMAFPNFNIAVFTAKDRTLVDYLSVNLLTLWAQHAASLGHDPNGAVIESADHRWWKIIRSPDGHYGVWPLGETP